MRLLTSDFCALPDFPPGLIWAVVHIYFLIGFANRFFVLLQWGLGFATKRRRVRILTSQAER